MQLCRHLAAAAAGQGILLRCSYALAPGMTPSRRMQSLWSHLLPVFGSQAERAPRHVSDTGLNGKNYADIAEMCMPQAQANPAKARQQTPPLPLPAAPKRANAAAADQLPLQQHPEVRLKIVICRISL